MLLELGEHRSFLLRDSESKPGDYSLSVRDQTYVKHYRIKCTDELPKMYFISKRESFRNLYELVTHYQVSFAACAEFELLFFSLSLLTLVFCNREKRMAFVWLLDVPVLRCRLLYQVDCRTT